VLEEAYVLPETLNLRHEIAVSSGVAATVKRGERVEVIARRRRFVRVRASENREGWTEQGQLLTPAMAQHIEQVSRQAAQRPRLGTFKARDTLNVHLEPYRWSPTIYQLKEEEDAEMLERRPVERLPEPAADTALPAAPATEPAPSYPKDEWCFILTAGGRAGWVLGRMIYAGIPDEVAQYAERRRITSYHALAEVTDRDETKKIWLWTTTDNTLAPYDFDSLRVFNWGRRRHRYETALIERGLRGYFPVTVTPSVETRYGTGPGFSVVIEKDDGRRYARRYVLLGHLVRRYAEEPAEASGPVTPVPPAEPPPAVESPGFFQRLWDRIRS
jgi:hypothetical protein